MPLTPLIEDDLEMILPWRNAPAVRRAMYTHHEISLEEHRAWFARMAEDSSRQWLIYRDSEGEAQGVAYFTNIDVDKARAFGGFYLSPTAARITALEVELEGLDFAFNNLMLEKVFCEVLLGNQTIINFHLKVGFLTVRPHQNVNKSVAISEGCIRLSMEVSEWPQNRKRLISRINRARHTLHSRSINAQMPMRAKA